MKNTPLVRLIDERCDALGIDEAELARRLPFKNWSKTRRRLMELRSGRIALPHLVDALPAVLEVPEREWRAAVAVTIEEIDRELARWEKERLAAEERHWRATFKPHALWLTERRRPIPIFPVALCGVDAFLRHDWPADLPRSQRLAHALAAMPEKAGPFGAVRGLALNHSPDAATLHARDGTLIEASNEAVRPGSAALMVGSGGVPFDIGWVVSR